MKWINDYLSTTYVHAGRGPRAYDCWGLVRHVRHFELGFALLPTFGHCRTGEPLGITKAYDSESQLMERCQPEHGAIAAVVMGRVCVHVALVIEYKDQLMILETNPERGAIFLPLVEWQRTNLNVTFHRDKS